MTQVSVEEWSFEFVAHIVKRLTDAGWDADRAREAATNEFEGLEDVDTTADPAAEADESLSYWDDDEGIGER